VSGICRQCPANSFYNSTLSICQCLPQYTLVSGNCVFVQNCQANEILINGVCQCQSGFVRNQNGQCVRQCGNNEYLGANGQCVCQVGYQRAQNGLCYPVTCANNQVFNATLNRCVDRCQPPFQWNSQTQSCVIVCPSGSTYNPLTNTCVQSCGGNQVWNGTHCVCVSGCQPQCPLNADFIGGKCVCRSGFYEYNNQCIQNPCQNGQQWNPQTNQCVCIVGTWNGQQCVCPAGTILSNGQCIVIPCGQN
jgi:hypothetical protein